MRRSLFLSLVLPCVFLACDSTPEGFTPEAWERLQREQPNQAQVVRWVQKDGNRREFRKQFLKAWSDVGRERIVGEWLFDEKAEYMMLHGGSVKEIKASLIATLESEVSNIERDQKLMASAMAGMTTDLAGDPIAPSTYKPSKEETLKLKQAKNLWAFLKEE